MASFQHNSPDTAVGLKNLVSFSMSQWSPKHDELKDLATPGSQDTASMVMDCQCSTCFSPTLLCAFLKWNKL